MKLYKLFLAMIFLGLFVGALSHQVLQPDEEEASFLQTGESSNLTKNHHRTADEDVTFVFNF
jgi:hypothetical protein